MQTKYTGLDTCFGAVQAYFRRSYYPLKMIVNTWLQTAIPEMPGMLAKKYRI